MALCYACFPLSYSGLLVINLLSMLLNSLNDDMKNKLKNPSFSKLLILSLLLGGAMPTSAEVYFNPRFLADDPSAVADLSSFENGIEAPPGTYRVDIYLNDAFVTTRNITFKMSDDKTSLDPCLTRGQLASLGVSTLAIPGIAALDSQACVPLSLLGKDASSHLDMGLQRLYLSIPQALLHTRAQGYIPPDQWSEGVTAGILNYSFTGNNARSSNAGSSNYAWLNLQSGLNIDAWRLRDNSTWSYSSSSNANAINENKWQHVNTYLERDIIAWKSRLTLGDSYTPGDIFEGVNFRGVQLASSDTMLPDSQQGFAPVIHGIAQSTARVSIKQNGFEIYQMTVPAGPFTINDLYPAGNSGDLMVTVTEADGSVQSFSVPYSSVPMLQREGRVKYAFTAAEYRSGNDQQNTPHFVQSTALWGLPAGYTLYGGAQAADNYRAFDLGLGKNLGVLGAVSFDLTQAQATLTDDSSHSGQSLRFLYSKTFSETSTSVQLAGYRYSTQGYYTLADTTWKQMRGYAIRSQDGTLQTTPIITDYYNLKDSKRGKLQASVTQRMGDASTLFLTGSQQTYWNNGSSDLQLQAGLSSAINDITLSVNYSLTKNAWQDGRDQMLAFSVSVPFSHWMPSDSNSVFRRSNVSMNMSNDLRGRSTSQAGVYGTLLEGNNLNYSVQTGYAGGGQYKDSSTGTASLYYQGAYGNSNLGYSNSDGYRQVYYGLSGGVLAHANGITFSQPLNDTVVLVAAPGAKDVALQNITGVRTDWRGYAIQPYASEYRENRIALNTSTLPDNVDIEDSVISVVPTHGAVVRADFHTSVGLKALLTINMEGKPVPFGAVSSLKGSDTSSIVGDSGQTYLTGLPQSGVITVKWGDGPSQHCSAAYTLAKPDPSQTISYATLNCQRQN